MGYWEQIGHWNADERERRARLPRWRRQLAKTGAIVLMAAGWIVSLAMIAAPFWR